MTAGQRSAGGPADQQRVPPTIIKKERRRSREEWRVAKPREVWSVAAPPPSHSANINGVSPMGHQGVNQFLATSQLLRENSLVKQNHLTRSPSTGTKSPRKQVPCTLTVPVHWVC
jgi:hypothetical protein